MTLNLILAAAAVCGLLLGLLKLQTARLRHARAQLADCEQRLAATAAQLAAVRDRAAILAKVERMDDATVQEGLTNDYRD
ncbi:hypothetical protein [Cardiobacterium valvarum]|uniref:Uncharacterized protein n=1 Tax=Cardiobacterium valvarum TaxID=194702 RepID=A0A381EFG5_9GAMM|nr:hypothetical protein [Cardiobacterium valvarum]SUX25748.1 Uncharacterised protein [Cardiobacterium valvarum]